MRYKEPKEMAELHKIREEISKEYANNSIEKVNRDLIARTEKLSYRLKLPRLKTSSFSRSKE